jgi:hypothetical protein
VRLRVPIVIREVSREGFSIESSIAFPPGSQELFHFSAEHGWESEIAARCMHCDRVPGPQTEPRFLAGFVVLPASAAPLQHVVEWLDRSSDASVGNADAPSTDSLPSHDRRREARQVPGSSRRRLPRFEVTGEIEVTVGDGAIPSELHDIGLGGFAVTSDIAFVLHRRHAVRFTTLSGLDALVMAETIHARQVVHEEGPPQWVTGFAYVIETPEAHTAVEAVLDQATACLSFL